MGHVLDVIARRRSIRKYKGDPIPEEVLTRILEAGRLAPSASNRQPGRFVVVRDAVTRKALSEAARGQAFIAEAPVVLVACGTERQPFRHGQFETWPVDLAIALDHISLAAADEGVGSCWIGAFVPDQVRALLGIPDDAGVFMLMPLGYPDETPAQRPRKPFSELFILDRFQ